MLSPEQESDARIETKATDLSLQFIAGRTTDLPQALWHPETRSIWVRGVYRRGEKGESATTHVKMKIQPLERMYPSASLSAEGQTTAQKTAYQRIATGYEHIDPAHRPRTPTPHKKLATVVRMRIQGEKQNDVEQAFGGLGETPEPFYFVYQKVSSESGIIRLGACFFTKVELIDREPSTGKSKFMGRYQLVPENHTDHWTPEIRLVVPTTYTRYIEKVGEKSVVFVKGLEYRSDCGAWTPTPMERSMDDDDSQTSGSSDEEEGLSDHVPMGSCSPSSKGQKRTCKRYKPGRLPGSQAKRTIEEFLTVQEWMDTNNMLGYSTMVAEMLEKRTRVWDEQEPKDEARVRPVPSSSIFVNEGVANIDDMNDQLRKMWGCVNQLEEEIKKTREFGAERHEQVTRALHLLRANQTKRKRRKREGEKEEDVQKKRSRKSSEKP